MKETSDIENRQSRPEPTDEATLHQPNLAEMMNHPERYSEEELQVFFDQPENEEDYRYATLARMADRRHKVSCPDAEQAWKAFKPRMEQQPSKPKAIVWRMWAAAFAGAAAMLVGVILYNHFTQASLSPSDGSSVVAMLYDETPQDITLQNTEGMTNLSQKDSLSFKTPQTIVVSQPNAEQLMAQQPKKPKMQKLSTPRGMDFKVILPDGSEVWLNAESTIEFPAAFLGNERQVILKGEAYFKVARNEECPFIVTSNQMKVRVLGTEFNFKSYTSETPHVSLIKGSVEVEDADAGQNANIVLRPGQDAWRDAEGSIRVQDVDTYAVTQWVKGFFYFDGLPLVEILRELGRWYNLGVIFHNPADMQKKMHFSASRNESIDQAIENLNRLRKVRVTIEGMNIVVH